MVSIPHAFCTSMWLTLKLNESSGKFRTVRPSGGGWVRDGLGEGWAGWLIRPHQQTGGSSPASSPAWTHGSTKVEGSLWHSSRHIPLSPKPHLHSPLMKTTSQVPWARLPWPAACTGPVKLAWERSNYSLFEAELFSVWISGSEHDLHPYRDPLRNSRVSISSFLTWSLQNQILTLASRNWQDLDLVTFTVFLHVSYRDHTCNIFLLIPVNKGLTPVLRSSFTVLSGHNRGWKHTTLYSAHVINIQTSIFWASFTYFTVLTFSFYILFSNDFLHAL